jgi:hypothetical protein
MFQFSEQLTRSGTIIKDSKRNTWVTKEYFQTINENVYDAMVNSGEEEEIE